METLKENITCEGRCGIQNQCGIDTKAFVLKLKGNLASGSSRGGPIDGYKSQ